MATTPTSPPAPLAPQLGVAAPRTLVHRRRIQCEAYHRDDGFIDVDAWLLDTRGHDMPKMGGPLPAGAPLHEMGLRITIDMTLTIRAAFAVTLAGPSQECPDITPAYAQLVGLVIGPGLREKAKALLRGRAGCTHLTELLGQTATTAMQAMWWLRARAMEQADPGMARRQVPGPVDSCHAWRSEGVLVQFHRARLAGFDAEG